MPKDYKNRRRQTTASKSPPRWRYFFSGLVLGLGVAAGVFFFGQDLDSFVMPQSVQAMVTQPEEPEPAPVAEAPKAKFDFYQVLPEMEVAVEEAEIVAGAPVVEGTEPSASVDGSFVIQVASFRQLTDADGVKASLALIGLEGHIQTVSIEGQTWHRVRLGPFNELTGLNDARSRLYENDFDAQVY